jgi:hypothetical protein
VVRVTAVSCRPLYQLAFVLPSIASDPKDYGQGTALGEAGFGYWIWLTTLVTFVVHHVRGQWQCRPSEQWCDCVDEEEDIRAGRGKADGAIDDSCAMCGAFSCHTCGLSVGDSVEDSLLVWMPGAASVVGGRTPCGFTLSQVLSVCRCGPTDPRGCAGCACGRCWKSTDPTTTRLSGGGPLLLSGTSRMMVVAGRGGETVEEVSALISPKKDRTSRGSAKSFIADDGTPSFRGRPCCIPKPTSQWCQRLRLGLLLAPVSALRGWANIALHLYLVLHEALLVLSIVSYSQVEQKDERNHSQTMIGLITPLLFLGIEHTVLAYAQCLHSAVVFPPALARRMAVHGAPSSGARISRSTSVPGMFSDPLLPINGVSDFVPHKALREGAATAISTPDDDDLARPSAYEEEEEVSVLGPLVPQRSEGAASSAVASGGSMAFHTAPGDVSVDSVDDLTPSVGLLRDSPRWFSLPHQASGPIKPTDVYEDEQGASCCPHHDGVCWFCPRWCGSPGMCDRATEGLWEQASLGDPYALEALATARTDVGVFGVGIIVRRACLLRPSFRALCSVHGVLYSLLVVLCLVWFVVWLLGTLAMGIVEPHIYGTWAGADG